MTSQKADYAYLAYVEVISSVIFFSPWDVVLIKKKKKLFFFLETWYLLKNKQTKETDKQVSDLGNFCVKIVDFFVFCDKTQKQREREGKKKAGMQESKLGAGWSLNCHHKTWRENVTEE